MPPSPILCLMGPTAVGKTAVALELARLFPCEIVSVDSAMVYRTMDIGTAKPSEDILKQYPHHLINVCDPTEPYSAAKFCEDAKKAISTIQKNNRIPLLVGGTLLYYRALQEGLSDLPTADPAIRATITDDAKQNGWPAQHYRLEAIDPAAAKRINPHDSQRIMRALEVFLMTGISLSQHWQDAQKQRANYNFINVAFVPDDRAALHKAIEQRFDTMLQKGFVGEVEQLFLRGDLNSTMPSMRTVGYRQIWHYLEGMYDYDSMRERSIFATRQFAKRQLTWLRGMGNVKAISTTATTNTQQLTQVLLAYVNL